VAAPDKKSGLSGAWRVKSPACSRKMKKEVKRYLTNDARL
jgi:hypothetical protein